MITCSTIPGRIICGVLWNMGKEKNLKYLEQALSGIPEDFHGTLLEVPVGTGVLTMPVYRDLPDADITCLDYSPDMMKAAQKEPENYKDLLVRVAGYSAYFVELSTELQNDLIGRTELSFD